MMTEEEVKMLFVRHPFPEAKRLLREECERNGYELQGHETVFELRAIAEKGLRTSVSVTTTESAHFVTTGENGWSQSVVSDIGTSNGAVLQDNGQSSDQSQAMPNGWANNEPSEQSDASAEGGEPNAASSSQTQTQRQSSEQSSPEDATDPTSHNDTKMNEPQKRKRRSRKQIEEANESQNGEPDENETKEQTPEELDEEARKKAEEGIAKHNKHYLTNEVVRRLKCIGKAFLVGPAGTGKSSLAIAACKELFHIEGGMDAVVESGKFAQISFSPDTVSADMLGFTDVNGVFHETDIIKVFREGGVILFDEMDDADASLLVKLNTMLANRVIPTPNGIVCQNENTYIIGTANTFGTGSNSMYVGRSRLDGATLDRWKMATILVEYDEKLEAKIRGQYLDGNARGQAELAIVVRTIRDAISANKWKQICSTRFVIDSCKMMAAGYKINKCVDTFLLSWEGNNVRVLRDQIVDNLKALDE